MQRCEKCSYPLVLLPDRRKYKCSVCKKLYPQVQIELKEFKTQNKVQRELEQDNFDREKKHYWQERLDKLKEIKKAKNVVEQWAKLEAYYKTYYSDDLTLLINQEYDYVFQSRNEAVRAIYKARNPEKRRI